jgi:uncharacterized repeat protein (TIGR01451 family)
MSRQGAHAWVAPALVAGVIAFPVVAAHGHDRPAAAPRVPSLAISIGDGQVAARPGQVLTYTASLRNTGSTGIAALKVTQVMSAGLQVTAASSGGVRQAAQVSWSSALPAGGTRTFRVTARVTKVPAQLLRLAAVACVTLPDGRQPVVCAAHLDRLPAVHVPSARRPSMNGSLFLAATAIVLLAGCLLAVLLARRRRPAFPEAAKLHAGSALASQ